jgi:hypothetical protein
MADLDTFDKRDAHARALARHYGLTPHGVEALATLPKSPGGGPVYSVLWIDSPAGLLRAGLVSRRQVDALLRQHAGDGASGRTRTGLQWVDGAGTRWTLGSNGGVRGDEFGLWLSASYLPDAEPLPPAADAAPFVREVEALVRRATGIAVRFSRARSAAR